MWCASFSNEGISKALAALMDVGTDIVVTQARSPCQHLLDMAKQGLTPVRPPNRACCNTPNEFH